MKSLILHLVTVLGTIPAFMRPILWFNQETNKTKVYFTELRKHRSVEMSQSEVSILDYTINTLSDDDNSSVLISEEKT